MITSTQHIHFTSLNNNTVELAFDMAGNKNANLITPDILDELNHHLDHISQNASIQSVLFTSRKANIFIAGADITLFEKALNAGSLEALIQQGQDTFERIAQLPQTTVAAIHGACLGGGYELALACDYRVASDHKKTQVGLPEVQLGILPGWGGSVRLPRLIGLPQALGIILPGKVVPAKKAKKLGMIDQVVPPEYLQAQSISYASRNKAIPRSFPLTHNPLAKRAIARKAKQNILKQSRGLYPAPLAALDVVIRALSLPTHKALACERAAILKLAASPECHQLIRIFFMNEAAKKARWKDEQSTLPRTPHVTVLGAGVMGAGIAHWTSSKGSPTYLKDIKAEFVAKGMATIEKLYRSAVKRRKLTPTQAKAAAERVTPVSQDIPMSHVDIVIEAVVEKMDIKQQVFRDLEQRVGPHTLLASNTSALSLADIGSALQRPERLVGIHFFNPVHRMPLVEVVRSQATSDPSIAQALAYVQSLGKTPIVVSDRPGFLVNRVLMPYLLRAIVEYEQGVSAEKLDKALLQFGMPMGPIRLIDEVGLDVVDHVGKYLSQHLSGDEYHSPTLDHLIQAQHLGKKTGQGFYQYNKGQADGLNEQAALRGQHSRIQHSTTASDIAERLIFPMINEALLCLEENVVESIDDVDLGMIFGTGWAPFRGGPITYAINYGFDKIYQKMNDWHNTEAQYPQPCALLATLAENPQAIEKYQVANSK